MNVYRLTAHVNHHATLQAANIRCTIVARNPEEVRHIIRFRTFYISRDGDVNLTGGFGAGSWHADEWCDVKIRKLRKANVWGRYGFIDGNVIQEG